MKYFLFLIALLIAVPACATRSHILKFQTEDDSPFMRRTVRKARRKFRRLGLGVKMRRSTHDYSLYIANSRDGFTRGSASICTDSFGKGVVFILPVNRFGQDRRKHAVIAVVHEGGHLLGADHDSKLYPAPAPVWFKRTIMHWDPLSQVETQRGWRFSKESKQQIKDCLR